MATKRPANPALTKVRPLPHDKENKVPKQTPTVQDVLDKTTKGVPEEPKKPGTSLIDYEARMAALVVQTQKAEAPQGGYISLKNSRMSVGDVRMPNDTLRAIIIDYRMDNELYLNAYDGKPQSPSCHAVMKPWEVVSPWRKPRDGEDVSALLRGEDDFGDAWVADCEQPQVAPGVGCDGCRMLEFGSAKFIEGKPANAKGKACRESRRLHLFAADQCTTPADIARAGHMTLIPPPTSLDNFKRVANEITTVLKTPIFGAVVDLVLEPHPQYLIMLQYKVIEKITDPAIMIALLQRHEQISQKVINLPKIGDDDKTKDARGGKF
jgi:hypothetical protein